MELLNFRVTYKKADVQLLEKLMFKDIGVACRNLLAGPFAESLILQTCNRVEIYASTKDNYSLEECKEFLVEYWSSSSGIYKERLEELLEISTNNEAIYHLFQLASGIESMIVGENQILGQIRDAYSLCKKIGAIKENLDAVFRKAINVGSKVRAQTNISKGSVSVASAAVDLAEKILGTLRGRRIMVVGAGEMGTLAAKSLAERGISSIFIANRTYSRAVSLANMFNGIAVKLDNIEEFLPGVDVIIVATSAPHYIITREKIERVFGKNCGKKIVIIDLSTPRNVDENVKELPFIKLYNIDDLKTVAEENLKKRQKEAEKAKKIVDEHFDRFLKLIKRRKADRILAEIFKKYNEIRERELKKALSIIGEIDDKRRKVIEDMSYVLLKRFLHDIAENVRKACENDDDKTVESAKKIFGLT